MTLSYTFKAGMPQLDVHTLMEDWSLSAAAEQHWGLLARSLGATPSNWLDNKGQRMYGAMTYASTWFDLQNPVLEDDDVTVESAFLGIRKPHAKVRTEFKVKGETRVAVETLSVFVKRDVPGDNKKFSKVRDVWTEDDFAPEQVDDTLGAHHELKSRPDAGNVVHEVEVVRFPDFNNADLMYYKNYVRLARTAEWKEMRGRDIRLPAFREAYFYGNANDGEEVESRVHADGDELITSHFLKGGRRIFLSIARTEPVSIRVR